MTALVVTLALAVPVSLISWWAWTRGEWEPAPQICRRCHLIVAAPLGDLPAGTVTLRTVVCHDCRELDARAARLQAAAMPAREGT